MTSRGIILSTDMVDPYIRNDWWRQLSDVIYDVTPADGGELAGSVRSRPFGELIVGNTSFNSQFVRRTRKMVARDELDLVIIQLVLSGDYYVDFGGTNTRISQGDIFFLDLARCVDSRKDAGKRISIVIPRKRLMRLISVDSLHGVVLRSSTAMAKLLAEYVSGFSRIVDIVLPEEVDDVQDALIHVIAMTINKAPDDVFDMDANSLPIRQKIIDYIDRNLFQENIGVDSIVVDFRISRSHLYRAFESYGGVAKIIREKRLDIACKLLSQQNSKRLSIKEIAYRCGFTSVSSFTKNFGNRFGVSPGKIQERGFMFIEEPRVSLALHNHLLSVMPDVINSLPG